MTVCRPFFEWMRMNNCHSIDHMHVGKECDACHVRYKQYRQEATHDM